MPKKNVKINDIDTAKQNARDVKRKNRLNSIKNELESGRIQNFDQIFAIISETRMAVELGLSFYTFRKKVQDPGEFTVNEMMRLAALFDVKYDTVASFIWDRIRSKSRSRIFRE